MASKLMTKLEKTKGWAQALGCGDADIKHAQEYLDMILPADYKAMVKELGALVFPNQFKWFGLNVSDQYDMVVQTKAVQERVLSFPAKHFVLQLFCDETCAVVNEAGEVFHLNASGLEKISNNLTDYLVRCMTDPVVKPEEPVEASQPAVEEKAKGAKKAAVKGTKQAEVEAAPVSAVDW